MNNKTYIAEKFGKAFETYNKQAVVQKKTADTLVRKISAYNKDFRNIFEIGAGSGLLTDIIENTFSPEVFYYNDISVQSELYIKKNISFKNKKSYFIEGDIENITLPEKCDLIISNAVFQWLDNLDPVFEKIYNVLSSSGIIAFSTFGTDNFRELKYFGYGLKTYKTLSEIIDKLEKNFSIIESYEEHEILTFNTITGLFRHISDTGVNCLENNIGYIEIKKIMGEYEKKYKKEGIIPLTYHPQYFIAERK